MVLKQKHPRRSKSCTECRRRKQSCQGPVPGCHSCRQRGLASFCNWGDERDLQQTEEVSASSQGMEIAGNFSLIFGTPSDKVIGDELTPASSTSSSSKLNSARIHLMNVLAQEDAQPSEEVAQLMAADPTTRHRIESWRLPNYAQACELLKQHEVYQSVAGLHLVDYAAIRAAYDIDTGLIPDDNKSFDIIALLLFVCAAALSVIPGTKSVALGLVRASEEIDWLGDTWINAAWQALEESDQYTSPSMEGTQAIITYQYNLSERGSRARMVSSLDQAIRAARQLGLDRLGSKEMDEQVWAGQSIYSEELADAEEIKQQRYTGWWAAKTLREHDCKAREFGRSQWVLLLSRDWAASRTMGTYSIHPHSFDSRPPKVYAQRYPFDSEREEVWPYILEGAKVLRCFGDACANATTQSPNGKLSYDSILVLDAQIIALLNKRPAWMRAEDKSIDLSGIVLVDAANDAIQCPSIAALISCTLWQRLYVIHRPFLARSISDPETYGLSAQRTLDNAMLFLKTSKQKVEEGTYSLNQSVLMIHLHQAALVIITHLLLFNLNQRNPGGYQNLTNRSRTAAETDQIHNYLNFAIATLKTSPLAKTSTNGVEGRKLVFEGIGERLEALLAASSNLGVDDEEQGGIISGVSLSQWPDQLLQLDARLQEIAELGIWPREELNVKQDWSAMNDIDWQQIMSLLS